MASIGNSSTVSGHNSSHIGSPTGAIMMSTPTLNDNIINKKADPAQGLYQTCLTLRERLRDVPDFEKFLDPPEDADPNVPEDPVTQLWGCFRKGSSLCVLFNATKPDELIREDRLNPYLKTINDCKAATFHFLKGIKQELNIDGDDAFMIHNLYSDDTNGFVKVTKTVTRILDILQKRGLLLTREDAGLDAETAVSMPLDSRARIVKELVDTERKYVQDLEILQEYMRQLEREEIVSKDVIHNLFLNLNQLVDFQRRFLIRVETHNSQPAEQQNWGNLFVQYEKAFTVYEPYASNFNGAQLLAQESRDQLLRMPHPVLDQLAAFLIKPVQRVTKYPLLLKDLIKHTPAIESEEKQLPQGLEAITRITSQINEAIRRSENSEIVKDLEGRVEDWKGHKLEHFGDLLLHGQFSVIKGDAKGEVEREYYIYLFERILLCCKEMGVNKKSAKAAKNMRGAPTIKKRNNLQLKGRIFMQNVTDVISLARNGSYTLQIFWKGDPGVENFKIQHPNEEGLTHWKKILQGQREQYTRADTPGRTKGGMLSTAATEFAWMAHTADSGDHGQDSQDVSDDDDDITVIQDNPHLSQLSGTTLSSSRNGSTTSLLRSRSATNENMPPPPPPSAAAFMPRSNGTQASPAWYPQQGNTPPLTLNTNPIIQALANSPERSNASYFSPVETPMPTGRSISSNSQGYFPRYTSSSTTYYEESIGSHYAPSMSRTSSREGSSQGAQYTAFQSPAFQNSQRLQRPSLPGMGAAATSAPNQQSRMRSASSPNIHHMPVPSGLSRSSPGGNIPPVPSLPIPSGLSRSSPSGIIPPVPSLPGGYIPYSGGPAVTNRNPEDPPASPDVAFLGAKEGPQTPGLDGGHNGLLTPNSGLASPPSNTKTQIKVKIHYNNDTLAIIVPYNIAYSQLIDRIERKVKFCGIETPIRIRYQDEDGDKISMNSDDDVQMAFDVAGCEGNGKDIGGQVTLYVQVG